MPTRTITPRLWKLAVPIMLTNLLQMAYNLVDTWFLGRIGAAAVSAPAIAFNFIFFLAVFGIGFSMAGTTLVAQAKGAGDTDRIDFYASQTVTIVATIGIVIGVIGFFTTIPLLRLLNAPADAFDYARIYMQIVFSGIPLMFFFFVMQALMHGMGDSITPLKIQLVTVVLNLVLDPIFIFGFGPIPRMEVAGAATATVISRSATAILSLVVLLRGARGLRVRRVYLAPDRRAIRQFLEIGFPASLGQGISALGFTVLQGIVNGFGVAVIAAFGIANRIIGLFNMPAIGLSKATATIVGQELGADRPDGARHTVRTSVLMMLGMIVPAMTFTFFFGNSLVRFFVDDPEVIRHGATLFKIVSVSVVPFTLFTVINGAFEGGGVTRPVMVLNVLRLWGLRVPIAAALTSVAVLGPNGIWIAMFISNVATATIGFLWLRRGTWLRKIELVDTTVSIPPNATAPSTVASITEGRRRPSP
jgi:putative MATE family efflux protein